MLHIRESARVCVRDVQVGADCIRCTASGHPYLEFDDMQLLYKKIESRCWLTLLAT